MMKLFDNNADEDADEDDHNDANDKNEDDGESVKFANPKPNRITNECSKLQLKATTQTFIVLLIRCGHEML